MDALLKSNSVRSYFNYPDYVETVTNERLMDEIKKGIQTIQYQVITLMTTNGQAPFLTVYLYLNEAKDKQEKADLALLIEETLKQRCQGVKMNKVYGSHQHSLN